MKPREIELSEKLGELNGTEAKLSGDIEGLKEELRLKNELIESVENELSEKESSVDSKRRNVFSASEELSALRNETGRMQASLEALERKEVSLIKDAEDSKKVLGEIDLSIRDVEGSLRDKNAEALLLSEKKSVYTSEAASLRGGRLNISGTSCQKQRRPCIQHISHGIFEGTCP